MACLLSSWESVKSLNEKSDGGRGEHNNRKLSKDSMQIFPKYKFQRQKKNYLEVNAII